MITQRFILFLVLILPLYACNDDLEENEVNAGESVDGMAGEDTSNSLDYGCYKIETDICNCEVTEVECTDTWTAQCGCGDGTVDPTHQNYIFESRFESGSSISYSGQTARHALIAALKSYMENLESSIASNGVFEEGSIVDVLNIFFECVDDICGGESVTVSGPIELAQMSISDISSGKNLVGKIAGNDETGQHKNWSTEFVGWTSDEVISPESLVRSWFVAVESNAIAISNGQFAQDPSGADITRPDVSANGQDYTQLVQKFLLGAIAFSQGVDDYLDDDIEGKGIASANDIPLEEGKLYTALEHNWDEGFGYFGAARNYLDYSDDEISKKGGRDEYQGSNDADADGVIDLVSEFNWGHSVNAAKRDRGSSTNLTDEAYMAFYQGRTLIMSANGNLSIEQLSELQGYRDTAVMAWEKSIAATVIHYINDVLTDMNRDDDYSFYDHAKHWSEMKGFALSFQFNPRSPVSDELFIRIHELFGNAPALPGADYFEEYRMGLIEARSLLGAVYDFDDNDVENW